ncbi:MAG: DUF4430 domain-containing protein [Candidatus Magasanikbacteria bacterium]|nr:DUF4430 domain-containing protein [Candidatus Magasanikbacteria bacterium]
MKHFVKKHTHHFGLWALSGLLLIWSMIWLNNLDKQTIQNTSTKTAEMKSTDSFATGTISQNILRSARDDKNEIASAAPRNDSEKNKQPISATSFVADAISNVTPIEKPDENSISVTFKFIAPTFNKEFPIKVAPQSTVYEAMQQLQEQIPIKFSQFSSLGAFVETIDNLTNDSKSNLYWIYYINGQAAKLGVSYIKLNHNDIITWRYENAKF